MSSELAYTNECNDTKFILDKAFKSYKCFGKNPYISGTLCGVVFKSLRNLQGMESIMFAKFCADISNHLVDIAAYDNFQNGRQAVHLLLAKSVQMDLA